MRELWGRTVRLAKFGIIEDKLFKHYGNEEEIYENQF